MKLEIISKFVLVGCVTMGLAACSTHEPPAPIKPPRHVCDNYGAHTMGIKDGMHRQAIDFEYAEKNNCKYNDAEINRQYLAGYQYGRSMK